MSRLLQWIASINKQTDDVNTSLLKTFCCLSQKLFRSEQGWEEAVWKGVKIGKE